MDEFFVALVPKSPLRLGTVKPKTDYLDTLPHVPGVILRGALAEWLKRNGKEKDILSIVKRFRFGNLFPSPIKMCYALPFPMTALECKIQGGFQNPPKGREKGHGIRDSLILALAYYELEKSGARFPVPMTLRCGICKGRMERVSGFYASLPEGRLKISSVRGVQTKVALSRYRRAAQEQLLYRIVALQPQECFVGRIWLEDEKDLDLLCQAIEQVGLGSLTTRGFGAAQLSKSQIQEWKTVSKRVSEFNERLKEVWRDLADLAKQGGSNVPDEPKGNYFSVDLLSPAILNDEQGLPTLKLSLEINGEKLEPVFWATQPAFIGGWSMPWGLPKPTALGAAMSSVYVFRTKQTIDDILPKLEELEAKGVGERNEEGLGEILVCHPFHLEVNPI